MIKVVHISVSPIVCFFWLVILIGMEEYPNIWQCFFIKWNCSFFMGIIFCSSVAQVWTFNTRGVYNFITKEVNIPVNLVPFFNEISFLFCHFLKSGVTNDLKEQKSQNYLFQTGQNFAAHKTLVWSIYVWRTTTATIFFKKE